MRLTKEKIDKLCAAARAALYEHPTYKQRQLDYRHTVYHAVMDTDIAASGMVMVVGSLPKIVKDQLPKVSAVKVRIYQEAYANLEKYAKALGIKGMPSYPFDGSSEASVTLPDGAVFYSVTAGELREFNLDNEASIRAWAKVSMARGAIRRAESAISEACGQLEQLAAELVTLDRLMQAVPACRPLIPATWLEPEVPKPDQSLVDEETAARLRALILGVAA